MKGAEENVQNRFIKLFNLSIIIETIIRVIFCLSFANNIYILSLLGVLIVFTSIYILYIKKALNIYYTVILILSFYFFTHFIYILGTFSFEPIMFLWLLVIPLVTRIYFSSKMSILSLVLVMITIFITIYIPFFHDIANHYKEIVLDHYGRQTSKVIVHFFVAIIFAYIFLAIYYLIKVLTCQHLPKTAEVQRDDSFDAGKFSIDLEKRAYINNDSKQLLVKIQSTATIRLTSIYELIVEHVLKSECFLDSDYSLEQLSNDLNINKITVSKALNRIGKISFKEFINQYRVNKAKEILSDDKLKHYNIKQVYLSVGFKYHTTFNRAFKKQEGMTPSEYIAVN